jgi:hypothetical protein
MATALPKSDSTMDSIFDRASEASDQVLAAYRKVGNAWVDSYEKAFDRTLEFELKLAGSSKQDWLKGLIETQAEYAREIVNTYTSTARSFLK